MATGLSIGAFAGRTVGAEGGTQTYAAAARRPLLRLPVNTFAYASRLTSSRLQPRHRYRRHEVRRGLSYGSSGISAQGLYYERVQ